VLVLFNDEESFSTETENGDIDEMEDIEEMSVVVMGVIGKGGGDVESAYQQIKTNFE
jgi:hypothetical protein